ncbi:MAG TPA: class I SAM-dependent methyltransferase [Polyangiaceae bacterium]
MQPVSAQEPPTALMKVPPPPSVAVQAVECCDVCGASQHRPFASGYDYELETCSNLWHFVCCETCEHVWLHPRPAVQALQTIYPPHYYAYNYDQQIGALLRWGKAALDRRKLAKILGLLARPPRSYLDIGCGNGRFLKVMEQRGLSRHALHGLELSAPVVEHLAAQGYRVFNTRVEDCHSISSGSIDLITMFHVIEHVDAPGAVIERLADWLAPGGTIALETPNLDSLDARMFREHFWGGYHIPRHWHLFAARTLSRLLERAGLKVDAVRYQPGHSFWLYSLHHRLKYGRRPRPRLARRFDPFQALLPLVAATGFDIARATLGFKTSAMLVIATKR